MKKYRVKVYYTTFCYREVLADDRNDAYNRACEDIDGTSDVKFADEIVGNLRNDDDPEIIEIEN